MPKKQTNALLVIFMSALVVGIVTLRIFLHFNLFDSLRLAFLYISAMLAYIISYSAIEADSPTLLITLMIAQAGSGGLLKDDLKRSLGDDCLLIPRLKDLVRDGLAIFKDNRYALSLKGSMFIKVFIFYRTILGAQKGG